MPPKKTLPEPPLTPYVPTKKRRGDTSHAPLDRKMIRGLSEIHCTMAEMATLMDVSVATLERHYMHEIHQGREHGKQSLRRMQWEQAEKGNVQMLIWLGKQILGQKERQPDEATQIHYNVFCNEIPK